jgi:hypothetical protein
MHACGGPEHDGFCGVAPWFHVLQLAKASAHGRRVNILDASQWPPHLADQDKRGSGKGARPSDGRYV